MKSLLCNAILLVSLVCPFILFSQVGIGTTEPTTELDVVGNVRVRGLESSSGRPEVVSAKPDGTLVIASSDPDAPGHRFIGFLSSDIILNVNEDFKNISLTNELIDVLDEYDTSAGRYEPSSTGYFRVGMDFDIGEYTDTYNEIDVLIGFWDFTDNKWVLRRTFKHKALANDEVASTRAASYGITNYVNLQENHSYGFRIYTTYDADDTSVNWAVLKSENGGSTGSSLSTSFSIERVL